MESLNKQMSMKKSILLISILLVIFGSWQYYDFYCLLRTKKKLREITTKIFTIANVDLSTNVSRSHQSILYYNFIFNEKVYRDQIKVVRRKELPPIPFHLIVVIDSINPKANYLLKTKKDFNYFNKSIPDTLLWIENYFR